MSLIDELAASNVDLENVTFADLGIDLGTLGWTETEEGILSEVVRENDKHAMNNEEKDWLIRVLDTCRRVHATGIVRIYWSPHDESPKWNYNGLYGAATIVTEADLRMACAHFIRVVDLSGFNPNSSVILHQELYENFQYQKLTPWFHSFEMDRYTVGLSFSNLEHAEEFYESVQYCMANSARDIVDEDVDSKEKTYHIVGDKDWRTVDGTSLSVNVARKYAAGGITDGTEVSWKRKVDLPPELRAALGEAAPESPTSTKEAPVVPGSKIDLMSDSRVRRNTVTGGADRNISDGITMQWSKNKKPLTGGPAEPAPPLVSPRKAAPASKKKKVLGRLGFGKE